MCMFTTRLSKLKQHISNNHNFTIYYKPTILFPEIHQP